MACKNATKWAQSNKDMLMSVKFEFESLDMICELFPEKIPCGFHLSHVVKFKYNWTQ
jgi:hypothetical protein